jgi:hypothetical protein
LVLANELDAALDGFRAGIAEEHRVGERQIDQPLGQLLAVAHPIEVGGVPERGSLLGQGLDQSRVAVAQRVHGDAGREVDETSPVRRVEIVALSAFEHDVLATVRRHHSRNHETLHKRNNPLFDHGSGTD